MTVKVLTAAIAYTYNKLKMDLKFKKKSIKMNV